MGSGSSVIASTAAIGSVEGLMKLENVVNFGSQIAEHEIKSQYKKKKHECQCQCQHKQSTRNRQTQNRNYHYDPD